MAELHPRPWEPEEAIGSLWHRLVGDRENATEINPAAVSLETMRPRMGIVLRGLGGDAGAGFTSLQASPVRHRRRLLQKIGHAGEKVQQPLWDGETLSIPQVMGWSSITTLNEATYLWLAAWAAKFKTPEPQDDPLRWDLHTLRAVWRCRAALAHAAPGLGPVCAALDATARVARPQTNLPEAEAAVESLVRHLLGGDKPVLPEWLDFISRDVDLPGSCKAPTGYCTFAPVFHWPQWSVPAAGEAAPHHDTSSSGAAPKQEEQRKRARRRASDQARRRDPLILHRFETIKTWAEMFNLGRKVEDDDPDTARKAADDQDELGLADTDAKPASRIAFDLDLSPQEMDRTQLSEGALFPEWDWRRNQYLPEHVRVLAGRAAGASGNSPLELSPSQARLVARVRRQFEALVPRHTLQAGEDAGSELDLDAAVRMAADMSVGAVHDGRIFKALRPVARDLAVLTLADVSRSTEGIAEERAIIDIARETLLAMVHGLAATGDAHAIATFSSVRRDRVFYDRVKDFGETLGPAVLERILSLRPGHYTRMGAAIRQATQDLRAHAALRRLLLVVTDGKPNDIDHYEGRFGIEDTRRAVLEARMAGLAVFAITIDRRAEAYVPHIFGRNGFHIVSHPSRLAEALPGIYRHLIS
jgi:nitric oxide reductase NorD protein